MRDSLLVVPCRVEQRSLPRRFAGLIGREAAWPARQIPGGDMLGGEPLPGGGHFLPQPPQLALERLQRQPLLIQGMLLQTHEQLRGAAQRH